MDKINQFKHRIAYKNVKFKSDKNPCIELSPKAQ